MAAPQFIEQQKAVALQESIQSIERLLGEPSERLYSAQFDVAGRTDPHYVSAMLVSELVRVVARQQAEIEALKDQIEKPKEAKLAKK